MAKLKKNGQPRKAYEYKSAEAKLRAQSGLQEYRSAVRKARRINELVKDNKLATEYEAYVKEYYSESKRLRKAKVKFSKGHKQGLFIPEKLVKYESRGKLQSIGEFKRYRAKYSELSIGEIVSKQYNLINANVASEFADNLKKAAEADPRLAKLVLNKNGELIYTIEQIQARQVPTRVWDAMTSFSKSKGLTNSQYFFGSI